MTYLPSVLQEFEGRTTTRVKLSDTFPVHQYYGEVDPKIRSSIEGTGVLLNPLVGFLLPEEKRKWNGDHRQRYDNLAYTFRNDPEWLAMRERPYHIVCGCQRWWALLNLGIEETDMLVYDVQTEWEQMRRAELHMGKTKF